MDSDSFEFEWEYRIVFRFKNPPDGLSLEKTLPAIKEPIKIVVENLRRIGWEVAVPIIEDAGIKEWEL